MNKKKVMLIFIGIVCVSFVALLFLANHKKSTQNNFSSADKIAVIHVDGVITSSHTTSSILSEGNGGTDQLIKDLHAAAEDNSVKAIVMRINSPGGAVTATEEVGEEMNKIRDNGKPIVVSMGDTAASGAYWLSACADKVYANPTTVTGSIGVYMPYSNWEELYQKIGIRQDKIKSGIHKDILSSDRPMTPEEHQMLQAIVDELYNGFVDVVAKGRHMDRDRVKQLADGRIYTGKQAKELGLVDELGNYYDALDGTAAMVGISGKPQIKEFGKENPLSLLFSANNKESLLKELFSGLTADTALKSIAPQAMPEKW